MSTPPNSTWRGCASNFPQPLSHTDELAAQCLQESVYFYNCRGSPPRLADVIYRSSSRDHDVLHHVFRWDTRHYEHIFRDGFEARRQEGTPDDEFFDLDRFVHHGGAPLDSGTTTRHAFVSTSLNSGWRPMLPTGVDSMTIYRYEVYAPRGILVRETLDDYRYQRQDEVTFVAGIAPQYIRSAQLFTGSRDRRFTTWTGEDSIVMNPNFNPYSHSRLNICRPISRGTVIIPQPHHRLPRSIMLASPTAASAEALSDWYASEVLEIKIYITAAFRSSRRDEAYLFMDNEYLLINYAPGTTDDKVLNGPLPIARGFPSLARTAFAGFGIDCAFGSHDADQAFIFCGNLCATINFAPGTTDDFVIRGPTTIAAMFPFFKGTVFEGGVDAAFEATTEYEAYLFKDDRYALVNYGSHPPLLVAERPIADGFGGLRGTIFERGMDAAFASHRRDEAYLFKGDRYALINFAPGTTDDYFIGGVKEILPNWPSLVGILPRENTCVADEDDASESGEAAHEHDEL